MIDFIQGDKFIELADYVFCPDVRSKEDYGGLLNTLNTSKLGELNIIYTHTFYVKKLLDVIRHKSASFILITHNSDACIDSSYAIPENVIKWWSQNVDVNNEKVESIPIGLENSRWFPHLRKKEKMSAKLCTSKRYKNLVYMNHNIKTNLEERIIPYKVLEEKPWVTVEKGVNGKGFDEYLENIYNHSFIVCPRGNGFDTHRTWETLYMGSIPIEKRNINNQFYTDLPICFVDDWEEVTEEFLNKWLDEASSKSWNMDKLMFNYWKERVLSCKKVLV
jgi:hypothetical protein